MNPGLQREQRRVSQSSEDAHLRERVLRTLAAEPLLGACCFDGGRSPPANVLFPEGYAGSVEVLVNAGIVTLAGEVASESERRLVGLHAARVPGCRQVVNALAVQGVSLPVPVRGREGHS